MNAVQTFWLEPTDRVQVGLRRYSRNSAHWTCASGWHQALVITGTEQAQFEDRGGRRTLKATTTPVAPTDDPRWPRVCADGCGYEFTDDDHRQHWQDLAYLRSDTGEMVTLRDAPPGACWDAWWMPGNYAGPDGIALMVRLPDNHDWTVDSQSSNCTRKGEPHACWVRHGDPRECRVTVDKDGDTCAAGAGSIATATWHGFLRDGRLVVC